jgi:hypothetical protein
VIEVDRILKQLDAVLARHERAVDAYPNDLPLSKVKELLTSAQAAIERLAPPRSAYAVNCKVALKEHSPIEWHLEVLMGIVTALRHDYEAGSLVPIQELIRAEVFDDFLEMAEHLLDHGSKDPSAVLAGGVLEQHLRTLCGRTGISTETNGKPKKADAINSELTAAAVYSKLDQKSVTSWLDLRNS